MEEKENNNMTNKIYSNYKSKYNKYNDINSWVKERLVKMKVESPCIIKELTDKYN
jgi:hypothetical protein